MVIHICELFNPHKDAAYPAHKGQGFRRMFSMKVEKYWCPYCQAIYSFLPNKCTFCKKEIPPQATKQISFVHGLEESIRSLSQPADAPLRVALQEWCRRQAAAIQEELAAAVTSTKKTLVEQPQATIMVREPAGDFPTAAEESPVSPQLSGLDELCRQTLAKSAEVSLKSDSVQELKVLFAQHRQHLVHLAKQEAAATSTRSPGEQVAVATPETTITAAPSAHQPEDRLSLLRQRTRESLQHPVVRDNLLLFLGILLILVGEVWVVSHSWQHMSDQMRLAGIFALLFSPTLLFYLVGLLFARHGELANIAFACHYLTLLLLPLNFTIPGELLTRQVAVALPMLGLSIGLGYLGCKAVRARLSSVLGDLFFHYFLPLACCQLLSPFAASRFPLGWTLLVYGALLLALYSWQVAAQRIACTIAPESVPAQPSFAPLPSLLLWLILSGVAVLLLAANASYRAMSYQTTPPAFAYAIIFALMALSLAWVEWCKHRSPRNAVSLTPPRHFAPHSPSESAKAPATKIHDVATARAALPWYIGGSCLGALALSLAGGHNGVLLATLTLGAAFFALATWRTRHAYFLLAALLLALLSYLLLPVPFREGLKFFRVWFATSLGYPQGELPYCYYALTVTPYLVAVGCLCFWCKEWQEEGLFRAALGWLLVVATGLLLLTELGGRDPHVFALAFPLYACGFIVAMRSLQAARVGYLVVASIALWCYEMAMWQWPQTPLACFLLLVVAWCCWAGAIGTRRRAPAYAGVLSVSFLILLALATSLLWWQTFSLWPLALWLTKAPPLAFSVSFLVTGLLWLLSVFVVQNRWLFVAVILHLLLGATGVAAFGDAQNEAAFAAVFLAVAYLLCPLYSILYHCRRPCDFLLATVKEGWDKGSTIAHLMLSPLRFVVLLFVVIGVMMLLPATFTYASPLTQTLWLSVSVFLLTLPLSLQVSVVNPFLIQLPVFLTCVVLVDKGGMPLSLSLWLGATFYLLLALAMRQPYALAAALAAWNVSFGYCLYGWQVTLSFALFFYLIAACLWHAMERLYWRRDPYQLAVVLEWYVSVTVFMVMWFTLRTLVLYFSQAQSIVRLPLLLCALLAGVISALRAANRGWPAWLVPAFVMWSGGLALAVDYFWAQNLLGYGLICALWGLGWHYLPALLGRTPFAYFCDKLKHHPHFALCVQGCAITAVTGAYALAQWALAAPRPSLVLYALVLTLVAAYLVIAAIKSTRQELFYFAFFVINQTVLCCYLFPFAGKDITMWVWPQVWFTACCPALLFVAGRGPLWQRVARASAHYTVLSLAVVLVCVALWRLQVAFGLPSSGRLPHMWCASLLSTLLSLLLDQMVNNARWQERLGYKERLSLPLCSRLLPYWLGIAALFACVLGADMAKAAFHSYPLLLAIVAIVYAAVAAWLPDMERPLDRLSIGLSVLAVGLALFTWLEFPTSGRWLVWLSLLLCVHAFWYWLKSGDKVWAYTLALYAMSAVSQEIAQNALLPWYTRSLCFAVVFAFLLSLGYIVAARQAIISQGRVTLRFCGSHLSEAFGDLIAIVCTVCLPLLLWLWSVLPYTFAYFWDGYHPLFGQARDMASLLRELQSGWWLATLLVYLGLWSGLACGQRWRALAVPGLMLTLAQLFLWFPRLTCLTQGYAWSWPLLEWVLCALLLSLAGYFLPQRAGRAWALFFALAAAPVALLNYKLGVAVAVALLLAFSLLLLSLAGMRRKEPATNWYPLYLAWWAVAIFLVVRFYWLRPSLAMTPLWLVSAAWPIAALLLFSERYSKAHSLLLHEAARFTVLTGLSLVTSLVFLQREVHSDITMYTIWGLVWAATLLVWLGQQEKHKVSWYLAHFTAAALYLSLRWQVGLCPYLSGHDSEAIFVLFAALPCLTALSLPYSPARKVLMNSGLLLGFLVTAWVYYGIHDIALTTLLLSALCPLLAMREIESSPKEQTLASGTLTIIAGLAAVLVYFDARAMSGWWLCGVLLLLATRCTLAYLISQQVITLFFACSLGVLSIYPGLVVSWLNSDALLHPLWLLLSANLLLLPCLLGGGKEKRQLTPRLALVGQDLCDITSSFAALILAGVNTVALVFLLGLVADIGLVTFPIYLDAAHSYVLSLNLAREFLAQGIWQQSDVVVASVLFALATAWHLARYPWAAWAGKWLLLCSLMIGLGLLPVASKWLQGRVWEVYAPPALEWALLGIALCYYGYRRGRPEIAWRSLWCGSLAIAVTGLKVVSPLTSATLFLSALLLLLLSLTRASVVAYRAHVVNVLAALYFFIAYVWPPTAKPELQTLPILALAIHLVALSLLAAAMIVERHTRRSGATNGFLDLLPRASDQLAAFLLIPAAALIAAATLLVTPHTPNLAGEAYVCHTIFCALALGFALLHTLLLARRSGKPWCYWVLQTVVVAIFYFLRYRTEVLSFATNYEPHALILIAFAFWQMSLGCRDASPARLPLRYAAAILPLVLFAYQPWHMANKGCTLFALAAAHFAFVYLRARHWLTLGAAIIFLHLALFQFWWLQGLIHAQFYGVPVGFTMLILGELNRQKLSPQALTGLRWGGLGVLYGACAMPIMLVLNQPMYWLTLGLISLIGILLGLWLNNALYTYVALAFFLADVFGYSLKYGAEHGILEGVLMVLAGTVLLGMALVFHIRRRK
jgi:hypothetical protein